MSLTRDSDDLPVSPRTRVALGTIARPDVLLSLAVLLWLNSGTLDIWLHNIGTMTKVQMVVIWSVCILAVPRSLAATARALVPLLAFVAYMVLMGNVSDPTQRAYWQSFFYLTVIYVLFAHFTESRDAPARKLLVAVLLADLTVLGVRTWRQLDITPEISRLLSAGGAYEDINALVANLWGIGTYAHAYALPAVLLVALQYLLQERRHRWVAGVFLLAGTALLVRMAFTIAVMFWLLAAILLWIILTTPRRSRPVAFLVLALTTTLGVAVGPYVLNGLAASGLLPDVMAVRVVEIADSLSGTGSDLSDLASRLDRYQVSLAAFVDHWPLGASSTPTGLDVLGHHSTWLDLLGSYGVAVVLVPVFLTQIFRQQRDLVQPGRRPALYVAWMYFGAVGLVNTLLFAHIFVAWLVLVPYLLDVLPTSRDEQVIPT